jgi:hypothetical protein
LVHGGADDGRHYPDNKHIEFFEDYYTISDADNTLEMVSFVWKEKIMRYSFVATDVSSYSFIMWDKEKDLGVFYFQGIKNDTLIVNSYHNYPTNLPYYPSTYEFVRVR